MIFTIPCSIDPGEVPYQPEDKKLPQSIPSSSLPPPPSGTANHSDQPTVHIAPRTHSTIQPKSLGTASSSMGREQGRQVVHTERGSPIRARLAWSSLAKSNLLDGVDQSSPVVQSPSTPVSTHPWAVLVGCGEFCIVYMSLV